MEVGSAARCHLGIASQATPSGVVSQVQTDEQGKPNTVERATSTLPPSDVFEMGVQTLGIPHADAFCQATDKAPLLRTRGTDLPDEALLRRPLGKAGAQRMVSTHNPAAP